MPDELLKLDGATYEAMIDQLDRERQQAEREEGK